MSCAGTEAAPDYNLTGTWTFYADLSSDCPVEVTSVTCALTVTQAEDSSSVSFSGTCTNSGGVTLNVSSMSGLLYGTTLSWGASLTDTVGDYTETDTIPCKAVTFTSDSLSEVFTGTFSVSYVSDGEAGTCSGTYSNAQFDKD